ncbi:multidrug efflux system outer membrane protein [Rhodobacter sp. JA431]|uniref:efflux transporter outer membrane subunit n=1 Tax=Rhodobacter sp. JA431 TaxID=570013 RepID=UPI000BC80C55|nr:efflux transporter outer membrane subunit [Rhodobacter sp. JA431]SOC15892.1 multidrug efflux system outer membrane protein [Rhodobacter sp. JA431]
MQRVVWEKRGAVVSRRVFLAGASAALAGCAQVQYDAPLAVAPGRFDANAPARADRAEGWWRAFRDSQLDALIAAGAARNLDVLQAVAAIDEARANAGLARASDLPQLAGSASATHGNPQGAGMSNTSTVGLGSSWMLDLFGANRANRKAAAARLDAAYLSADVARLTMQQAIAQAYAELRFQQASIALTRRSIESRKRSLELTRAQVDSGAAGRLELLQAEQLVAEGEAQLPAFETGFDQALVQLASLTAQTVSSLRPSLQRGAPQPVPRYRASVGVPADVLRVRPDVQMAERLYAASVYDIGVAKAAFFPSVTLTGAITPTRVHDTTSITPWTLGPALDLPIFTGGANRANLRGAEARALEAKLAWEAAVLNAIDEVETALAAYTRDGRNIAAQRHLVDTSSETLELSRTNYSLGQGDFMTVLDAERTYLSAQQGLAQAQAQRAAHYITLSVAAAGAPN